MYENITQALSDLNASASHAADVQAMLLAVKAGSPASVVVDNYTTPLGPARATSVLTAELQRLADAQTALKAKLDAAAIAVG